MRRRQGPLTRIAGPLVGLAAEALATRNSQGESSAPQNVAPSVPQYPSPAPQHVPPASQDPLPNEQSYHNGYPQTIGGLPAYSEYDGYGHEHDEVLELDEAAQSIALHRPPPPTGNLAGTTRVDTLIRSFMQQNPTMLNYHKARLQLPVMLPQRRPGNRSRGFVHAYAPMLMDCNISQHIFGQFLEHFEAAIKVSPLVSAINIAAAAAGATPVVSAQIISTAVNIVDTTAKETYARTRTNTFLDELNEVFWKPNGLFCMVMSYKPADGNIIESVDLNTLAAYTIAPSTSQMDVFSSRHGVWGGQSRCEMYMPDAAPLVFPTLDATSEEQRRSFTPFVQDYFDKRSQAIWAHQTPHSQLSMSPHYASSYADPLSVRGSTSLRGMLRSAVLGPDAPPTLSQVRYEMRQERRDIRQVCSGRDLVQGGGPIRNLMKQDALYLMIVNLPIPTDLHGTAGLTAY